MDFLPRIAQTPREQREADRFWEQMRAEALRIRDSYDREEERNVRVRVGGMTRSYTDAVVLFIGPPPLNIRQ